MAKQQRAKKTIVVTGRFLGGSIWEVNEKGKQTCNMTIDPKFVPQVEAAIKEVIEQRWGNKPPKLNLEHALRFGKDEEYHSFGHHYINASKWVGKDGEMLEVLAGTKVDGKFPRVARNDDRAPYAGCMIAASIDVYTNDPAPPEMPMGGVFIGINRIKFQGHGERLSTRTSAEKDFEDFEDVEEAELADALLD